MTENLRIRNVEEFVRSVLAKSFNQEIDPETLRAVAEKISRVVAEVSPKKAA